MQYINYEQNKRINKIYNEKFYFIDFKKNTINNLIGTLYISGSTKNVYEIEFYNKNNKKSFACNCPDNNMRNKYACKHICFVYYKIGRFIDDIFFKFLKLTDEQEKILYDKINNLYNDELNELINIQLLDIYKCITNTNVKNDIVIDDTLECSICYDLLSSFNDNIFCNQCKNPVHKLCLEKWLQKKNTCIYCRSDIIVKKEQYIKL
jgi:hypothetical protein